MPGVIVFAVAFAMLFVLIKFDGESRPEKLQRQIRYVKHQLKTIPQSQTQKRENAEHRLKKLQQEFDSFLNEV